MKHHSASIALISLLAITALTLILVVSVSSSGLSNLDQSQNFEAAKSNYYAAESCLEETLQRLEQDTSFNSTSITFDAFTSCTATVSGSGTRTVLVTVTYLNYTETYQATVSLSQAGEAYNSDLLTWEEI